MIDHQRDLVLTDAPDPTVLEQIFRLRVTAWREKLDIPGSVVKWEDALDRTARHWALLADGEPIAAARFSTHENVSDLPDADCVMAAVTDLPAPIGSLNRLVVHPNYQGHGLSKRMDGLRLSLAHALGCKSIVGSVSVRG